MDGVDRVEAIGHFFEQRRRGAIGGEPRGFDLHAGAQFHDVEHLAQRGAFVEFDPERTPHILRDEGADALARDDEPLGAQMCNRLANHGAADAGGRDHFLLGRQPRPRRELAARDIRGQPREQLLRQTARRR